MSWVFSNRAPMVPFEMCVPNVIKHPQVITIFGPSFGRCPHPWCRLGQTSRPRYASRRSCTQVFASPEMWNGGQVRVFAREIWWHMKYEMENNIEYTINHNKSSTISGSCKSSFHELFQVWESNETITMLLTGNRRYLPWIHMARYNNGPYKVLWKTQPLTRSRWALPINMIPLISH